MTYTPEGPAVPVKLSTSEFFRALFGDAEGHLTICRFKPARIAAFKVPTGIEEAAAEARRLSSDDVYFGIGLQDPAPASGQRGDADTVSALPGIWLDLDVQGPTHKAKNLPPDLKSAKATLFEGVPEPSIVVLTGGGVQTYWLTKTPCIAEDRVRVAALCERFQKAIQQVAGRQGWKVDSTYDPARVFRPPQTFNRKKGLAEPFAVIAKDNGPRYTLDELEAAINDIEEANEEANMAAFMETLPRPTPEPLHDTPPSTTVKDEQPASAVSRCRAMLASPKFALSVEGSDGSGRMFHACCMGAKFGLPKAQFRPLLEEYNRTKCLPPWDAKEVEHKLTDAYERVSLDGQVGELLKEEPKSPNAIDKPKSPNAIAESANPYAVDDVFGPGSETPPARPDVWHGVLHFGDKLFLGGRSKAGKTWTLMGFGMSVAAGVPYWNIPTTKSRVLYVNLELHEIDFKRRATFVRRQLGFRQEDVAGFMAIHLRGKVVDLDGMYPSLLATAGRDYGMIILDPLYKIFGNRNENDARDMTSLCNLLEKLECETGAAVVSALHYAKGNSSSKDSQDRISGSGVLTRAADALVMLTQHEVDDSSAVEFTTRDHVRPESFVVEWKFPLLVVNAALNPANLKQQSSKGFVEAKSVEQVMVGGEELAETELVGRLINRLGAARDKARFAVHEAIEKFLIVPAGTRKGQGRPAKIWRLNTKGLPTAYLNADLNADPQEVPQEGTTEAGLNSRGPKNSRKKEVHTNRAGQTDAAPACSTPKEVPAAGSNPWLADPDAF